VIWLGKFPNVTSGYGARGSIGVAEAMARKGMAAMASKEVSIVEIYGS